MDLEYLPFGNIDLNDTFFDSLKADYTGFVQWFQRKREYPAYIHRDSSGNIDGFLYYKIEDGIVSDVYPTLSAKKRLKIGTFKINPHGTRLGERFLKKSLDFAFSQGLDEIYVTIFPKYDYLISFFQEYGFSKVATKQTSNNQEDVLIKSLHNFTGKVVSDYPFVNGNNRKFILSIYPEYHSRLFPDSILNNESRDAILQDVSHTNSIHKIYLTAMHGTQSLQYGDILVIYRTTDDNGPALYRSVATSICTVEEVKNISEFPTFEEFYTYTSSYSVFPDQKLQQLYHYKKYPVIIQFTYNYAFPKRIIRKQLLTVAQIKSDCYWGFFQLSDQQFSQIMSLGNSDGRIVFY